MIARLACAAALALAAAPAGALPVEAVASPRTVAARSAAEPWRTFVLVAGAPWCPACRRTLEQLEGAPAAAAPRLRRAVLAHVDVDELPAGAFEAFAERHRVPFGGSIPVTVVFRGGVAVAGFLGALDAPKLDRLVARAERLRLAGAEHRRRSCGRDWTGPCLFVAP